MQTVGPDVGIVMALEVVLDTALLEVETCLDFDIISDLNKYN